MSATDRIDPRPPVEVPARPALPAGREGPRRGPANGRSRRQPPAPPDADPEPELDAPPAGRVDVIA